jgi:tetratricopeptide (TPR) repeat protein
MPGLAPAHRNLSIAYYNHGDRSLAAGGIAEACRLEPENSRFLLEQDQLMDRLERPVRERLALLEAHKEQLPDRTALMLAYITLLNRDGQHEKALDLLMNYTFHVWEGGEGKVAAEYRTALWALAEEALEAGKPEQALDCAMRSTVYPDNLGEGKLDDVPDNRAYFLAGKAYRMMGEEEKAGAAFREATRGKRAPEIVRYYNDQPSDYIYWQGLAFRELGDEANAEACFRAILDFGEAHLQDKAEYDFFAVSMPELEVYQDDIQQRSDAYCRELVRLGKAGLRE